MEALKSCKTCKQMNDVETRQAMKCGYEPPVAVRLPIWTPRAFPLPPPDEGSDESWPSTCAGYTVRLPEVIEAARARVHWGKGQLEAFCGGAQPSEQLVIAIEILEGSSSELQSANMTPEAEGGLAKSR